MVGSMELNYKLMSTLRQAQTPTSGSTARVATPYRNNINNNSRNNTPCKNNSSFYNMN